VTATGRSGAGQRVSNWEVDDFLLGRWGLARDLVVELLLDRGVVDPDPEYLRYGVYDRARARMKRRTGQWKTKG
jgi:hypothetical protein